MNEIDTENEDSIQTTRLDFVVSCQRVQALLQSRSGNSTKDIRDTLDEILEKNFNKDDSAKMISMSNPSLRTECEKVTIGLLMEGVDKRGRGTC